MEFAVTESVGIKNHRVNRNGFSPSQWVLGRNPPDVESLTTLFPEAKLGVHQEILDGESAFAQQMMIRGAAKEAFSQVDSSHATCEGSHVEEEHAQQRTLQHGRLDLLPSSSRRQGGLEVVRSGESDRSRGQGNSVDLPRWHPNDSVRGAVSTRHRW